VSLLDHRGKVLAEQGKLILLQVDRINSLQEEVYASQLAVREFRREVTEEVVALYARFELFSHRVSALEELL